MLKQNPNYNPNDPQSQRYIFSEPTVINQQTGQLSNAVFKKGTEVGFGAEPATPGMGAFTPASLTPTGSIITGELLTPAPSLKIETPTPTEIPNIANLPKPAVPVTPTPATDFTSQLESLQAEVLGAPAGKALKVSEATAGYQKQLDELNAQIAMHQANALERQEKALATGETLGFAAGEAQRIARTDAIEAMKLSSLAQAMQGNILTATKIAGTAADAEYADKEKELAATRNNIINNWDSFTAAEKKRAEATLASIDAEDAFVKEQKQNKKDIDKIAIDVAATGKATNEDLDKIRKAGDAVEAARLAAPFLQEEDLLSVAEAKALGVPYGTTRSEAVRMGITPSGITPSGEDEEEPPLTMWELGEFSRRYGWTPPYGFTQSQLTQYIADNPTSSPEELEAGAKRALTQSEGGEIKPQTTYVEAVGEIMNTLTEDEKDILFKKAKEKGMTSIWRGKWNDIKAYIENTKDQIEEAINQGYTAEEIKQYLLS